MKTTLMTAVLSLTLALPGLAQMGGGMGGGGQQGGGPGTGGGGVGSPAMMNGPEMIVVADDGSVLLRQGAGLADDQDSVVELINVTTDGTERWRVSFEESLPMRPSTAGDLVVLGLADRAGEGFEDDEHEYGEHGGYGGGMGGGSGHGSSNLVGIDLVSGVEIWRFSLEESSMMRFQITDDGSMIYVVVSDAAQDGSGDWNQGEPNHGDSTLYALDRFGEVLWSLELDDE